MAVVSISVHNKGDTAAVSCRGKLTLEDLEKKDFLKIKIKGRSNAKFVPENFEHTLVSDLNWERVGMKEKTIRPDEDAAIEVLRAVPAKRKIPPYLEIPSEKGWNPISAALRLNYLYGKLKITPFNGKPVFAKFEVEFHPEDKQFVFNFV